MKKTVFTLTLLGLALLASPTFAGWQCIDPKLTSHQDASKYCPEGCRPPSHWIAQTRDGLSTWLKPNAPNSPCKTKSACLCD